MCYINSTYHLRLTGWVGDSPSDVAPHLFAGADFAGDSNSSRSCSGVHLCLLGPNTVYPLAGQCKKQGCVSHSTPEAEVVAADHAMRMYGLPCLDLWDKLLGRPAVLHFHEDNETAICAMRNGYSPALRHVKRTRGVCIGRSPSGSPTLYTTCSMNALLCRLRTFIPSGSPSRQSGIALRA